MREVKFRAWHKKLKCWGKPCIGIDFDELESTLGLGVRYLYFHNKEIDELPTAHSSEKVDMLNTQDKIVIMQYAGVKDKNGREIYEGDIVLIDGGDSFLGIKQQYVIKYDSMNASYCFETNNGDKIYLTKFGNPDFFIKNKVEVIGNIHENPELIILLSDDA